MARKGQVTSEETRWKISEARKARVWTPEERQAMSARAKRFLGDAPRSEEHRRKISESLTGLKRSEETRQKISEAKTGKTLNLTYEQRAEISERSRRIHTGRVVNDQTRQRLSDSLTGRTGSLAMYGVSSAEYAEQIKSGNRWCSHGKHFCPAVEFTVKGQAFCGGCKSAAYRASLLRLKYGVDAAWYDAKLAEQGGCCAFCKTTEPKGKSNTFFHIDHDHVTGQVRGLLCSVCNNALERIETVPGWADKAHAYLARYAAEARSASISQIGRLSLIDPSEVCCANGFFGQPHYCLKSPAV